MAISEKGIEKVARALAWIALRDPNDGRFENKEITWQWVLDFNNQEEFFKAAREIIPVVMEVLKEEKLGG